MTASEGSLVHGADFAQLRATTDCQRRQTEAAGLLRRACTRWRSVRACGVHAFSPSFKEGAQLGDGFAGIFSGKKWPPASALSASTFVAQLRLNFRPDRRRRRTIDRADREPHPTAPGSDKRSACLPAQSSSSRATSIVAAARYSSQIAWPLSLEREARRRSRANLGWEAVGSEPRSPSALSTIASGSRDKPLGKRRRLGEQRPGPKADREARVRTERLRPSELRRKGDPLDGSGQSSAMR